MKKQADKIYLAYGSNLNLKQMAYRCPDAKVLSGTTLDGYRLLFRGFNGGAVATVEKHEGGSVPVLLWRISPRDEAALDRYEGWPRLYRKETVTVHLDGKPMEAMVYIMNEGRPLGGPGLFYYDTIMDGYLDAGFDPAILERAARFSVRQSRKARV